MTKLLVIDDEARLALLMKERLGPLGFQVDLHNNCRQAFEVTKRLKPDIVALDVMLGDGAGYQVSRQIRSDPALYLTPILFMSSLGDEHEVQYALSQGGDDYLTKPFSFEKLVEKLEPLRHLREKLQQAEPLTGLANFARVKREIDHRLLRNAEFGVAYLTVEHMDAFKAGHDRARCEDVIKMLCEVIKSALKELKVFESVPSYIGGSHFLIVLPLDGAKGICKELPARFAKRVREFYTGLELEQGYQVASIKQGIYSGHSLMELRICLTHTKRRHYQTAQEMVHDLHDSEKDAAKDDHELVFAFKQGKKW